MSIKRNKIMIVVGEASGDALAAKLVVALRDRSKNPDIEFFGATGQQMRREDVETIVEADQYGIVGVPEVARAVPMFLRVFSQLKNAARKRKPDAVVLVDFPEFNLKLAKTLKKQGCTVIYYVSPQLWAWRKYRSRTIKKHVDLLVSILPFEAAWYRKRGINNVVFVGNPLVETVIPTNSKLEFCAKNGLDPDKKIVALLAGSRQKEVARLLPILIETAAKIAIENPDIQFVNVLAANRKDSDVTRIIENLRNENAQFPKTFITVHDQTYDALNAVDAAVVTSGTATLEAAIIGTPLVIVYASSKLNWYLLSPLISVEHIGLVNLVAEERIAKELVQKELTLGALSDEILRLLESDVNEKMRKQLNRVRQKLGEGGASARAADAILQIIEKE